MVLKSEILNCVSGPKIASHGITTLSKYVGHAKTPSISQLCIEYLLGSCIRPASLPPLQNFPRSLPFPSTGRAFGKEVGYWQNLFLTTKKDD